MLNEIPLKNPAEDKERHLHIGVICRELGGLGSVAAVALRQARELGRYARVTLLSDSFPDNIDPSLPKHRVIPVNVSFLRRFSHVPRELAFGSAVKRCLHRLQEQGAEFDFLHCHGHSLIVAMSGFKRRFNVPCGLVAHGDVFYSPPGTYDWRLTKFFKWAIPRGYAQADLVVALSPHMEERAIACGADPHKIKLVPNGIDLSEIGLESPTSDHDDNNALIAMQDDFLKLLFVGVLDQRKGINVLLSAAKKLKHEGIRFYLAIVGDGPLRRELDELVALYDLLDVVTFYGNKPRRDLAKWYRWADVTCVPSINDPLPTVVLESLAAGTPIVGSAVGGIPFMVQTEMNGLLVPPMNPDALASAFARISRQPAFLRQLKQASTSSILPRFSWERNGKDLIGAIRKTLNDVKF